MVVADGSSGEKDKMMNKAVLLVTFNRKNYLAQVFAAVAKAQPPRLYLASDGPRDAKMGEKEIVEDIRHWMLNQVVWPCEVHTRFLDKNSGGCGPGVSGAVTWFFEHEKDGIVLEDDCVPTLSFFQYCEELLDRYTDDKRVWHIAGSAPIQKEHKDTYYFAKTMHCWGWAGWSDRWQHFSLKPEFSEEDYAKVSRRRSVRNFWKLVISRCASGKIETWDYQWTMIIMAHCGLCATPYHNLVSNVGDEGVHFSAASGVMKQRCISHELKGPVVHPDKVCINERMSDKIFTTVYCHPELRVSRWLKEWFKRTASQEMVRRARKVWRALRF